MRGRTLANACGAHETSLTLICLLLAGSLGATTALGQLEISDPELRRFVDVAVNQQTGNFNMQVIDQTGNYCPVLAESQNNTSFALRVDSGDLGLPTVFTTKPNAPAPPAGSGTTQRIAFFREMGANIVPMAPARRKQAPTQIFPGVFETVYDPGIPGLEVTKRVEVTMTSDQIGIQIPDQVRVALTVTSTETDFTTGDWLDVDLRLLLDGEVPVRRTPNFPGQLLQFGDTTTTPIFTRDPFDLASGIVVDSTITFDPAEEPEVETEEDFFRWWRFRMVDNAADPALSVRIGPDSTTIAPSRVILAGYPLIYSRNGAANYPRNYFDYLDADFDPDGVPMGDSSLTRRRGFQSGTSGAVLYWDRLRVPLGGSVTVATMIRPDLTTLDLPLRAEEAAAYFGTTHVSGTNIVRRNLYILDQEMTFAPGTVLQFYPGTSLYIFSDKQMTFEGVAFTSFAQDPEPGSWGGVYVTAGSPLARTLDTSVTFRDCLFEYGGGEDATRYAVYRLLGLDDDEDEDGDGAIPLITNRQRPKSGHAALTLLNARALLENCVIREFEGSAVLASINADPVLRGCQVETSLEPEAISGVTFMSVPQRYTAPVDCVRGIEHWLASHDAIYPLMVTQDVAWRNTDIPYVPEADVMVLLNRLMTIEPHEGATSPVRIESPGLVDFSQSGYFSRRVEFTVFGAFRVDPDLVSRPSSHPRPGVVFTQRHNPFPDPAAPPLMPVVPGPPANRPPLVVEYELPDPYAPVDPETPFMGKALSQDELDRAMGLDLATNGAPPPQEMSGNWGGVFLMETSDDELTVVYNAEIDRAVVGMYIRETSPRIADSTIRRCADHGMFVDIDGAPEVVNVLFDDNLFYGVTSVGNSAPSLVGCTIQNTGHIGMLTAGRSLARVLESSFINNPLAVDVYERAAPNFGNIQNNRENDDGRNRFLLNPTRGDGLYIRNNSANDIWAQNNFWGTSNVATIESRIIDKLDNHRLGRVIFEPLGHSATPVPSVHVPSPTSTPGDGFFVPPQATPDAILTQAVDLPGGVFQRDLTLSGRVRLLSDLVMQGNATLLIQPGTFIEVPPTGAVPVQIRVENGATLRVMGTRDHRVVLTSSNPSQGLWGGLVIHGESMDAPASNHRVQYTDISWAEIGIDVHGASPFVNHCLFQHNQRAMRIASTGDIANPVGYTQAAPKLRNNLFTRQAGPPSLLLLNNAMPDMGHVAGNDPGLNTFYLNNNAADAFDIEAQGDFALADDSIRAEGNYFTVINFEGELERIDNPDLIGKPSLDPLENRDRLNEEAGRIMDIAPLGPVLSVTDEDFIGTSGGQRAAYVIRDHRVWQGEIYLDRPVVIDQRGRLRILPGTRVRVEHGQEIPFIVIGILEAEGTAAAPIRFESSSRKPFEGLVDHARRPRGVDWVGIQFFSNELGDRSLMRYCQVSDARIGVGFYRSSPDIDRLLVHSFTDYGLYATSLEGPRPFVPPPPFRVPDAQLASVNSPFLFPAPRITNSMVIGGKYSLYSHDGAPHVRASYFSGAAIAGIYIAGSRVPDLGVVDVTLGLDGGRNRFDGHALYNVINHSLMPIQAQGNYWGTTDTNQVRQDIFDNGVGAQSGPVRTDPMLFAEPPNVLRAELGDLTRENSITARDVFELLQAWHKGVGEDGYNPLADFDRNYRIDHHDLKVLARRIGSPLARD